MGLRPRPHHARAALTNDVGARLFRIAGVLVVALTFALTLTLALPSKTVRADDVLVPLVQPGPWSGVSGLVGYGERLWFVNSIKFVNHKSADVYSYDPRTGGARYERHLFSQDAGDPVVADGLLYWPFEDPRVSLGRGEFMVTNGHTWRWHMLPQGPAFHVHAMATLDGQLFAATSAWRVGLQVSEDKGRTWRVVYDHPTPDGFVSRITALTPHDGKLYAGLTAWRADGPRLFRYDGDTLEPVRGFPEGRAIAHLASHGTGLYAVLTGTESSALWRHANGGAEPVQALSGHWVRDLAAGGGALGGGRAGGGTAGDALWAVTVDGDGGALWKSPDGIDWELLQQFDGAVPLDVEVYAGSVYVGTEGPDGIGTLWGPPAPAGINAAVAASEVPHTGPPLKTDDARSDLLATLDAAIVKPETYERHAGALRAALVPLLDRPDAETGRDLTERLARAFPGKEIRLIGGKVTISAATLARWHLLWAMARIGHGTVPAPYLTLPWIAESNRAEKYFDLPPIAAWAVDLLGQSDEATVEALISRIERDDDPRWLKGDFVGALTAVTGQRFGYDAVAWRRWWNTQRGG